jgi:hypothetical protein
VNDQRCGISAVRRNVAQRRIVGGDEAGFGTFPWQAYIRQEDNGKKDDKILYGKLDKLVMAEKGCGWRMIYPLCQTN